MGYSVLFIRVADGDESSMLYEYDFDSDFWWSDGNMSCDCNRYIQFELGRGNKDYGEHECSHDKYRIEIYDINGEPLYVESLGDE